MQFLFFNVLRLKLGQFYKYQFQPFDLLLGIVDIYNLVMMIVFLRLVESFGYKTERINRLQQVVIVHFFQQSDVCFGCIELYQAFEISCPYHLYFDDKLTFMIVGTEHIYKRIVQYIGSGNNCIGIVCYRHNPLIVFQRHHAVEQTDAKVFVFAEDAFENQIAFRVKIMCHF